MLRAAGLSQDPDGALDMDAGDFTRLMSGSEAM
jgi:hypothetical protein